MPLCRVSTNLSDRELPADFITALSKVVAEALGKPEERVLIELQTNVRMCRGGSTSGLVLMEIQSFEVFDAERNPGYSKKIIPFLLESLGLPSDRVVLLYTPFDKVHIGSVIS